MATWSVRVDATGVDYSEALDIALRERLAGYAPATGAGHIAGKAAPDRVSVQLTVEAVTLNQAADEARREVLTALREHGKPHLVRIDVMLWDEFDAELEQTPPELVGVAEIAEILEGVTRQRVHQLTKRPDFPDPIARLASGAIWAGAEVRRWKITWQRKSGRPTKTA